MTPEELERLAREAGFTPCRGTPGNHVQPVEVETLARFAALVRAQALEDAAREFDRRNTGPDGKPLGIGFYDPHEPAEIIRALKEQP